MKRTTDEMIYILSEYAAAHKEEVKTFDEGEWSIRIFDTNQKIY